MAYPTRDDLTYDKGNKGYGTMASLPEPGSAGDLAAEAASAGIVNTDASAELAKQVPNIVVPVNQSSDSDSNSDTYTYKGEFDPNDEATIYADERTGIESQIDLGDISRIASNPTNSAAMNRAIKIALSTASGGILTLPFLLNDQYQRQEAAKRQAIVDEAETARLADTPDQRMAEEDIAFAETKDYDEYSDTPTYSTPAPAYSYEGSDEQDEALINEPDIPQYSLPTYVESPAYSGGDSGGYDSGDGGSYSGSSTEDYGGGEKDGGFIDGTNRRPMFSGGIARLRKNKQNTRIHDRRKRLAMGGITSLHG